MRSSPAVPGGRGVDDHAQFRGLEDNFRRNLMISWASMFIGGMVGYATNHHNIPGFCWKLRLTMQLLDEFPTLRAACLIFGRWCWLVSELDPSCRMICHTKATGFGTQISARPLALVCQRPSKTLQVHRAMHDCMRVDRNKCHHKRS